MKIVTAPPPNVEEIALLLGYQPHASYCYGDTIFNPSGKELPADIIFHESVHCRQQGSNPQGWWYNYLTDPEFRLRQEVEAYGEQYLFAKRHIKEAKVLSWAKESMAFALSSEAYGSLLTYGQAESKIRNYKGTATTV